MPRFTFLWKPVTRMGNTENPASSFDFAVDAQRKLIHTTAERQCAAADAVDAAARTALGKAKTGRNYAASGTDLARRRKGAV